MRTLSIEAMSSFQAVREGALSTDCIKALIGEGFSYAALFFCSGPHAVLLGGLAIGGLILSAALMGIDCQ